MSTPILGPEHVRVDALVFCGAGTSVATVVKVTPLKLTVRLADGRRSTKSYTFLEKDYASPWKSPKTRANFFLLDVHEIWATRRPVPRTPYGYGKDHQPTEEFLCEAIRDRPEEVIAQVRLLSAWLKEEPVAAPVEVTA